MKFRQIKDRRIIQIISVYAAIGWVFLQIVDQVVDRSIFPEIVYKVALTLVLSLSPGVLIIAWFHGAKGVQKIPVLEKWLISFVVILSIFCCFLVIRGYGLQNEDRNLENIASFEDPKRIAVLYFQPRGEVADVEYISNGITESLIDDLSSIPELHVISQNGAELFRNTELSMEEIGKSLDVGLLVNGTLQMSKQKVRLRLSIVEASTGRQLENTRMECSSQQVFDLMDSLSIMVSDFLRKTIGEEINQIKIRRRSTNLDAWNLVQEAGMIEKESLINASIELNDQSISNLLAVDSLYAKAQHIDSRWPVPDTKRGWLAYKMSRLFANDLINAAKYITIGHTHADHALEMDPENPSALELKATLLYWSWLLNLAEDREGAFQQAEALFNQSISKNPKQASAFNSLSHLYLNKGWIAEAKQAARTAYSIDHYLTDVDRTLWRLFSISYDMGDTQETKRWCKEGLDRFPENHMFHKGFIMVQTMPEMEPNVSEAWAHLDQYVELSPTLDTLYNAKTGLQFMAMVLSRANLLDSARRVSFRGKASVDLDPHRDITFLESIVHLWMGDIDEAIRLMGLFFSANPGLAEGYRDPYLNRQLYWYQDGFYGQARFEALIGIR